MLHTTFSTGLGDPDIHLAVYVEKRPPMAEFDTLTQIKPLQTGEIRAINDACGNGWRKLFNVYAKLLYALPEDTYQYFQTETSWQRYRDLKLLQAKSRTALLFSAPTIIKHSNQIHIIAGRTYAKRLLECALSEVRLTWLDHEFACDPETNVIVCPYFDYRQLSNIKIDRLVTLIDSLAPS